jgi:hypothetical protein
MRWILTLALVSFLTAAALFVAEVESYARSIDSSDRYGAYDHNVPHTIQQNAPEVPNAGGRIPDPDDIQKQLPDRDQVAGTIESARMQLQEGISGSQGSGVMRTPGQSGETAGMRPSTSGGTPGTSEIAAAAASASATASASASASPAPEEEPTELPDTGGISLLLPAAALLLISSVLGLVAARRALS